MIWLVSLCTPGVAATPPAVPATDPVRVVHRVALDRGDVWALEILRWNEVKRKREPVLVLRRTTPRGLKWEHVVGGFVDLLPDATGLQTIVSEPMGGTVVHRELRRGLVDWSWAPAVAKVESLGNQRFLYQYPDRAAVRLVLPVIEEGLPNFLEEPIRSRASWYDPAGRVCEGKLCGIYGDQIVVVRSDSVQIGQDTWTLDWRVEPAASSQARLVGPHSPGAGMMWRYLPLVIEGTSELVWLDLQERVIAGYSDHDLEFTRIDTGWLVWAGGRIASIQGDTLDAIVPRLKPLIRIRPWMIRDGMLYTGFIEGNPEPLNLPIPWFGWRRDLKAEAELIRPERHRPPE